MNHAPDHVRHALAHATYRKSSFSSSTGNCVEVATGLAGWTGIRDSKRPGPVLAVTDAQWLAVVTLARS